MTATAIAEHPLRMQVEPVVPEFVPVCQTCNQPWPCPDMIAAADAEHPFVRECERPESSHSDAGFSCDGVADVRLYVFEASTGELWGWGVMTLCQPSWEYLRDGFLKWDQGLVPEDAEVLVVPINRESA